SSVLCATQAQTRSPGPERTRANTKGVHAASSYDHRLWIALEAQSTPSIMPSLVARGGGTRPLPCRSPRHGSLPAGSLIARCCAPGESRNSVSALPLVLLSRVFLRKTLSGRTKNQGFCSAPPGTFLTRTSP